MSELGIRRILTVVEETHNEGGVILKQPVRRAAAAAVIANPYAGRYVADLTMLEEIGAALGGILPRRAAALLDLDPHEVHSFGKAAIVGADGELEHAAALLHPRLGGPFREILGGGDALIPSAKKRGAPGTPIDVPLGHKDNARVRSHFDAMEITLPDAPRRGEIVVVIAITDAGRPLPRVGGLTLADIRKH